MDFVTDSCCGWYLGVIEPKISEKAEWVVFCYSTVTACGFSIVPSLKKLSVKTHTQIRTCMIIP